VGTTVRSLNLAGACLYVKGHDELFLIQAAEGTFIDIDKQNQFDCLINKRHQINIFPDPFSNDDPDPAYIIPLRAGDKDIGILFISQKLTRQNFSSTDIFLLQELAIVAGNALRNALIMREVSLRYTWISIASHELRAPLSAIVGYSDLLMKADTQDGKQKQWLKNIRDNGLIISDMADDLLNVSRIQAGKVSMKIESVKLPDILDLRVSFIKETTTKHQFTVKCEPDLPEALADRDKLGQVIGNLISNAVKYSPKGGIVTISAHYDTSKQRIIISVTDQGIGISKEDQATLFKTFNRIQRPETTTIRGSGLGLYIVKEWIGEMGGEVWMESELNKGSTFYISLPAQTVQAPSSDLE
jgi:signal transduction histidine kinase